MAENEVTTAIVIRKDDDTDSNKPQPNPILSFFSNFLQLFNFPPPKKVETVKVDATVVPFTAAVVEEVLDSRPVTVKYPVSPPAVEPLKLEAEELEQDTNPVVLWQVYAIGGFFVLRWALARWKERRAKKPPPPPPNDPSSEDPPANP